MDEPISGERFDSLPDPESPPPGPAPTPADPLADPISSVPPPINDPPVRPGPIAPWSPPEGEGGEAPAEPEAYPLQDAPTAEPTDLPPEPATIGNAPPPSEASGEALPTINEMARLRTGQRHQALAAGMLTLPNLFVRSSITLFALYGILSLVLITLANFGFLSSLGALLLGVVFASIQFLLGPFIMDLSLRFLYRLTWVVPEELPEHLRTFVGDVSKRENIRFPDFGIIDDGAPQAFTYGHHPKNARVVISRGLMEMLTPDELEAVVAHEIGHIRNWDMVLMTLAQLVPLLLYYLYDTARRTAMRGGDRNNKGRGAAVAVQVGAYVLYIISEYIVLWFSRTREYAADRFAGQATGNPNALAQALVKIAYGLAAGGQSRSEQVDAAGQEEMQEVPKPKQRLAGAGALGALNIFDRHAAVNLVVCSALKQNSAAAGDAAAAESTQIDPTQIDIERVKGAMQWDLWNPWAGWFELHSTHPLVAKRLHYLSDQAAAQGQQPWVVFDRQQPESYWDEFLVDVSVMSLPLVGLLAGLASFLVASLSAGHWQYAWLGIAAALAGVGLLLRTRFAYRSDRFPELNVAALMERVKVSPVRPVPATLNGRIIGKGVPGLIFSDDFVLRDDSGILFLDYSQPLAIWNFLFGLLRAGQYQGQEVTVRGWFRRAPVPYLEIYQLDPADGSLPARTCYSRHATKFLSYALIAGGLIAATYVLIAR